MSSKINLFNSLGEFEKEWDELETLAKETGVDFDHLKKIATSSSELELTITLATLVEGATIIAINNEIKRKITPQEIAIDLGEWITSNSSHFPRIKILEILGIIEKSSTDTLETLAQIRNKYAHNIKYAGQPIIKYIESLKTQAKSKIITILQEQTKSSNGELYTEEEIMKDFKIALINAVMLALYQIQGSMAESKLISLDKIKETKPKIDDENK